MLLFGYMRFLAIDYGAKRIGLALSDDGGTLAFPKEIILNDKQKLDTILGVIEAEHIDEIVVGESMDLSGKPNPIMIEIQNFIQELQVECILPIHKQKEFMTTVEARGREGKEMNNDRKVAKEKSSAADASAAALILQRYLDKKNKS